MYTCVRSRGDEVTALHVAVRHELLAVVSILLSHDASVNCASRYDRRTALQVAALTGNTDIVRLLVDNSAFVDQTDIYGSTALHLTVSNGRLDAAQVLLDCRSDVNSYDNDGWTALHLAAERGHLQLVKLLVGSKAYVECQTKFGRTPLHWACCRGHIQVQLTTVVVLDESPCPRAFARTNLQVLVLVLRPQSPRKLSRTSHSVNSPLCMIT